MYTESHFLHSREQVASEDNGTDKLQSHHEEWMKYVILLIWNIRLLFITQKRKSLNVRD